MREKRSEARIAVMSRIEVLWKDEAGTPHITPGKLEDESPRGASVRVRESIPVGSKLIIQGRADNISGTVVYRHRDSEEYVQYVLGIQRDLEEIPNPK